MNLTGTEAYKERQPVRDTDTDGRGIKGGRTYYAWCGATSDVITMAA